MARPLSKAAQALAASDPVIAALIERIGPMSIAERRRRRGQTPDDAYGALLRAVVGQQLSTKAARTIYERVIALFDGEDPSPERLIAADEKALRGAGLSGRKVEYLRDLAAHVISGELELDRFDQLSDDEVIAELTAVRGLGRWTAEMFLMFQLGRPDVWPVDDYGVRKGWALAHKLKAPPTPRALQAEGDRFRPYRSIAALYCWRAVDTDGTW